MEGAPRDVDADVDVNDISPLAWRLLRTAAGYDRRGWNGNSTG